MKNLYGKEAEDFIANSPEMKNVSNYDKSEWIKSTQNVRKFNFSGRELTGGQRVFELSKEIFKKLLKINAQFISGTDSGGGYPFMIPGFSLHEELRIFAELGMSPYEILRTTTVHAAEAMRKSHESGTVEVGKRADLLLISQNPLENIANLRGKKGVMVRGIWISDFLLKWNYTNRFGYLLLGLNRTKAAIDILKN